MSDAKRRAKRRDQQAVEIEANQAELRKIIAESRRLVDEADHMLRRHRKQCDDDAAGSREGSNTFYVTPRSP